MSVIGSPLKKAGLAPRTRRRGRDSVKNGLIQAVFNPFDRSRRSSRRQGGFFQRALSAFRRVGAIFLWAASSGLPAAPGGEGGGFVTLCYHDVVARYSGLAAPDAMPVTITQLADQFDWLRDNGYTVIGVDDALAARSGARTLPEKSVLLSFDDGFASFRRYVYPLLKAYNYKALLALQTAWMETPADSPVHYGGASLPRSYFLSWEQVREMADSGLVEPASHSHDLHRSHKSMPQEGEQPAGSTLAFDPATKTYESLEAFYARIRDDAARSAAIIEARAGRRPRVLVWPYGRYNQLGVRAALDAGYLMTASLGLHSGDATIPRFLMYNKAVLHDAMNRIAQGREPGDSRFSRWPADPAAVDPLQPGIRPAFPLQRVIHVDLDMIHDPDPEQEYRNISALFDRVEALAVRTVYLQAYADPDGDGTADALYFPNRHLPMRADLFNHIAWQLHRRLGMEVYAWMPVLGFNLPGRPRVAADPADNTGSTYSRLTPYDPENRRVIREIYEDMARHSVISGVLYHDDAILGDYEDDSPPARDWRRRSGFPGSLADIRCDPELFQAFGRLKTRHLIEFTDELTAAVNAWSPPVKTARNLYAQVALNPASEAWYAQNFDDFLHRYDYVGLMAMPFMEGAGDDPDGWLAHLVKAVRAHPLGPARTVFELQAVDWRPERRGAVESKTLARWMRLLERGGIGHFGYYPENPIDGHPVVKEIYPVFSLQGNPYKRRPYPAEPAVVK